MLEVVSHNGPLYTWYEIAGILLALPVAATVVWAIVKVVNHLHLVHEAIVGRPATAASEKIPSMIERFQGVNEHLTSVDRHLKQQDHQLEAISAELSFNGGESTKDRVRDLGHQLTDLRRNQDAAVASLTQGQEDAADTARDVSTELHSR